jgi:peptidase E
MGGGGFTMNDRGGELDRLVLELSGRPEPRICFLPTASGDQREQLVRFQERFSLWRCETSVLSLFHLGRDRIDPREFLLSQDAIYVGGGSMRNMLAIWREHRIDSIMREAWENGVVLAGLSAGAMCWFDGGLSMSGGQPEAVRGLSFLAGSLSVHRDSEPERWPPYRRAIAEGRLAGGYTADDGTALVFAGRRLMECVASGAGRRIVRVELDGGKVTQTPMPLRVLGEDSESSSAGQARMQPDDSERVAVEELRTVRALRQRWE